MQLGNMQLGNVHPWILALLSLPLVFVLLRRVVVPLFKLLVRTAVGLGVLYAFGQVSGILGVTLGVNLVNALVLGILGIPGFGLLLMLSWTLGS